MKLLRKTVNTKRPIQLIVSLEITNSDDNESITVKLENPQKLTI